MALSRDLASNDVWVHSLERSLARRGRPRRASLELGMLTPPRDLSDPDNLQESVTYWRTRRQASSNTAIPTAGGATALALIAATTLPALAGSHAGTSNAGGRAGSGGVGSASTRSHLVQSAANAHRAAFDPSSAKGLGATTPPTGTAATTKQSLGKVIYGSVDSVQRMLGLTVDGAVGPATTAAIVHFQSLHGLTANGIVDQATFDAMQAAAPQQTQTPAIAQSTTDGLAHAASASPAVTAAVTAPVESSSTDLSASTAGAAAAPSTATTTDATADTTTAATDTTTAADTTVATQPAVPAGVPALQAALHIQVDGTFGSATKAAVEAFQTSHGLAADGVVGPETRAALGLGAGPTLRDTQPPPPPPASTQSSSSSAAATTGDSGSTTTHTDSDSSSTTSSSDTSTSDSSPSSDTSTSTGEPADVATGMSEMIAAADSIATLPYIWGGGHGSFVSPGYDCSGSVSYVLHAAGLLSAPETSGMFESYGAPGPGKYITIYATDGHVWMTLDGQRFDTVALSEDGTRWGPYADGEFSGYVERHPIGY